MAYERKPNTGTFWPTKPGAKCDMTCRINIDGNDYIIFGNKKKVNVSGRSVDILEVSAMRDKGTAVPTTPVVPREEREDLPF